MSKITFKTKEKKYVNGIDYDNSKDYSKEIKAAAAAGDENLAARLEEERNKKIEGENLPYRKTYNYIDIGTKIENGIREGVSPKEIKELTEARRDKAFQNDRYDIYKSDEIQKRGKKYYYNAISGVGTEYENRPKYKDTYGEKIRSLLSEISGERDFSYNPEDDPVYLGLKKQTENDAKKTITNISAEYSQYGGGANSYAASAAASAALGYRAKLSEKLPELYQMAYKRYTDSFDSKRKALDYTIKERDSEFDRYEKNLAAFNDDREFADKLYENDLSREEAEDKRKYEAAQDKIDNDYRQKNFEYEKEKDKQDAARELNLYYEKMGISAPESLLERADMKAYSAANKESAAQNKRLSELSEILKNRQIANYEARTAKSYSDMNNSKNKSSSSSSATKTESKTKSKTSKMKAYTDELSYPLSFGQIFGKQNLTDKDYEKGADILRSRPTANEVNDKGVFIGTEFYSFGALYMGLYRNAITAKVDSKNRYFYERADKDED